MKRFIFAILILTCIGALVACNSGDDMNPYFTGKVIEVYENGCLLEVTDVGNGHFSVGGKVRVNTNILTCPEYIVGDFLRISFDGKVAESYPPQITKVFSVTKTDSNGNSIE